jgi:hypothetical protein
MKKDNDRKNRGEEFTSWLVRNGLIPETFAQACNPPMRLGTVYKWTNGAVPRPFTKSILAKQWPDCPLFNNTHLNPKTTENKNVKNNRAV